ncbi:MAG: c-type cytochrome [Gammaproteobacteria bacterium]|nr:c-type cytochrome [Gammaproteobacteria bacterium]
MSFKSLYFGIVLLLGVFFHSSIMAETSHEKAAQEVVKALELQPNLRNGRTTYLTCAVCHEPEGWGRADGYYPQIAGQLYSVIIKQMADIRARNRDNPTMFPFALLDNLTIQEIADVSAYIAQLPMAPITSTGPGVDLDYGKLLYQQNCAECHGDNGEGVEEKHMPLIQGQHYHYLIRQFNWIRDGKRRNADKKMVRQAQRFTPRDISAVMDYTSRLKPPKDKLAPPGWRNPDFPNYFRHPQPMQPYLPFPGMR